MLFRSGKALGTEASVRGETTIVVARDGRTSGLLMVEALKKGILETGRDVIDIGMVPTPTLYYAAMQIEGTQSGIMLTGSHNPPDYNGFKCVLAGDTLHGEAITDLYRRIVENDFKQGQGFEKSAEIKDDYINAILESVQLKRPLKVVVEDRKSVV